MGADNEGQVEREKGSDVTDAYDDCRMEAGESYLSMMVMLG